MYLQGRAPEIFEDIMILRKKIRLQTRSTLTDIHEVSKEKMVFHHLLPQILKQYSLAA